VDGAAAPSGSLAWLTVSLHIEIDVTSGKPSAYPKRAER
jgi:hypothetical protein